MEAKELMIGNYVQTSKGEIFPVACVVDNGNNNEVEPIPLTEEWLIKFGFDSRLRIDVSNGVWKHCVGYDSDNQCWDYYQDELDADCYKVASVKYVHQLQNLHFALTGEELTIKDGRRNII